MDALRTLQELHGRPASPALILRGWLSLSLLMAMGFGVVGAALHPDLRQALVTSLKDVVLSQAAVALRATVPPGVNFAAGPIQPPTLTEAEREQRAVAEMLSKRFRVAHEAVGGFVASAYRIGKATS